MKRPGGSSVKLLPFHSRRACNSRKPGYAIQGFSRQERTLRLTVNSSHSSSSSVSGSLGHPDPIQPQDRTRVSPSSGPLFPEVGIIAMVPYRWSHVWQPCNHILTRLARYFHVVWVNPGQDWSDSLFRPHKLAVPAHQAGKGFTVYQPPRWL